METIHEAGCMCDACQAASMQNIDGYASGMELAPDPNQHLSPDLINDPNFIASIVQQVLQQMNLQEDGVEEQLNLNLVDKEMYFPEPDLDVFRIGGDPINYFTKPWIDPCGHKLPMSKTKVVGENKIRKYISENISVLYKEFKKRKELDEEEIEEGTCGYGPNGNPGNTPGETNGMQAQRRTSQMRNINEKGPSSGQEMPATQSKRTYRGSDKTYYSNKGKKEKAT